MNPFVIGFVTKCAECGLNPSQTLALFKVANMAYGNSGISMSGMGSASTSSSSMSPTANPSAKSSMFPGGVNTSVMPLAQNLNATKLSPSTPMPGTTTKPPVTGRP